MKMYVATYVDYGETCDCKARVMGIYDTEKNAFFAVKKDMEDWWYKYNEFGEVAIDYDKMSTRCLHEDRSCEWNIEAVEVK